ncbi:MAG TPA: hypothetical protein VKY65_05150 [Alphaproteobacteria bacterium]|nr:hypothetical protein [Alphaproteobacteria bacterium]
MRRAEEWREDAATLRRLAETASDAGIRGMLIELARRYEHLAERVADRKGAGASHPPT